MSEFEDKNKFKCRFYEKEFPEVDDLVVVKVDSIQEMGAYTTLLEYDGIEGMILLSELSRRRIRSINKLIRVGREEIVMVLRVDKEKGYIDLSKSRVKPEEIEQVQQKYQKSKAVHGIMMNIAQKLKISLKTVYEKIAWPMYKEFGHAFNGLKLAMKHPETAFKNILQDPEDEQIKKVLIQVVKQRLKPKPVKLRADIELTCFGEKGIKAIQEALRNALKKDEENRDKKDEIMKICLVAPPLFVMQMTTLEKATGIERMNKAIQVMKKTLEELGGKLKVSQEPRAVSAKDEHSLAKLMEQLEVQSSASLSQGIYE